MAKKGARITVGLVCTESGRQNYVTEINKLKTGKIQLKKYSPTMRKHTTHKMRFKLK